MLILELPANHIKIYVYSYLGIPRGSEEPLPLVGEDEEGVGLNGPIRRVATSFVPHQLFHRLRRSEESVPSIRTYNLVLVSKEDFIRVRKTCICKGLGLEAGMLMGRIVGRQCLN